MPPRKSNTTSVDAEEPSTRAARWVEIIAKTLALSKFYEEPERFKTAAARIEFLTKLGFSVKDIATLAGTSVQVVANAQSAARKRKPKKAE
jgi:NAD-dependent DNA ligase